MNYEENFIATMPGYFMRDLYFPEHKSVFDLYHVEFGAIEETLEF